MNRQMLAEATSLHDGPVPIYLMEEISRSTKESARDAEKVADFLLGRLSKSNLIVKLKALQLIAYCVREGSPAFSDAVREEEQDIAGYLQYTGPPDPIYGDERYRRIRVASQEALVCLNDGSLSRHAEAMQAVPTAHTWQPSLAASGAPPAPYRDEPSYGGTAPAYGGAGSHDAQQQQQQGRYGPNDHAPAQQSAQRWGNSSSSEQYAGSRPAPYQDTPGASYGNPSGGYNAPAGGVAQYGGSDNYGPSGGAGGYGHSNENRGVGGYGYSNSRGGLDSWSAAPVGGSAPAKVAGAGGMWSSSGYQKKDPATSADLPRYNASSLARDNRPTVLVGQSMNFPKPVSGYGGASSGYGGATGTYGGPSGGYNGSGTYGGSSAYSGVSSGGYGGASGTYGGPSNSVGAGVSGYGGNQSVSGYGGNETRERWNQRNMGNASQFSSIRNGVGITNTQPLHVNPSPTTKLGKTVEGLRKISNEARERWDRRNMDKSMASSLADHDELRAGPQVMDRGYQYQPNAQHGTGGGDTSRDYERGMIDNLCASVGLSRAPPADALKRFVDLAQTLDVQTIGDILLDKLEDPSWQVRLKGLHVVVALLESPNGAQYMDWFEENVDVLEQLRKDGKPSVVSKTLQVLRILGFADEAEPQPTVQKRSSVRSDHSASPSPAAHAPAAAPRHAHEEVDLLGFGSLSIQQPTVAVPQNVTQPNIYGSPPSALVQAPPAPQQEMSLLDDFDPLGSSSSSSSYAAQQQQQQQQYHVQQTQLLPSHHHAPPAAPLDERSHTLSHFGKDLFAIANSPRNSATSEAAAEKSAFGFM